MVLTESVAKGATKLMKPQRGKKRQKTQYSQYVGVTWNKTHKVSGTLLEWRFCFRRGEGRVVRILTHPNAF